MNYLKAKKKFFDQMDKSAFALVNVDVKNGQVMLQNTAAKKFTFSLKRQADFKGKIIENNLEGLLMELNRREVNLRLAGEFNASNFTAVYGASMLLELDELSVLKALSLVTAPKGRMDTLRDMNRQITFIIDYAHTPDALENVLTTLVKINARTMRIYFYRRIKNGLNIRDLKSVQFFASVLSSETNEQSIKEIIGRYSSAKINGGVFLGDVFC